MGNITFRTSLYLLILLISPGILFAQTINFQTIPSDKMQFGFSFDKPFYPHNTNMSVLSGVYQLSFNIPVSSKLNMIGSVPFISTKYEIDYGLIKYKYDKSGFGNIFIGAQTNPGIMDNGKSIISFGLFLPTAEEQIAYNGLYINYYDIQKYIPNSLGLYFNYAYFKVNNEGFNYGLEVGPNVLIPTEGKNSEAELFIHYGVNAGYQVNKLLFNAEFSGIAIISQQVDNFGDRLINLLGFGAQWKESRITPKIFYRIYLREEMRNVIDGVLGVGVTVSIN